MARIAPATDCPCDTSTSTCRSLAKACSGRCFLLAISVLLRFEPIPRGGPLRRGRITLPVFNAELAAGVVAEAELVEVALQVLLAAVLIDAAHPTLEHAEEAFRAVRVDAQRTLRAARVLAFAVQHPLVRREGERR